MSNSNGTGRLTSFNALQLFAILIVALGLVPAGAHLFEMVNKLRLPPDQYMIAQRAYDGWALFGIVIAASLIAVLLHAYAVREHRRAMALSLTAAVLIAAGQTIFWVWIYPMNVVTANWTVTPPDLEAVRLQWEYSHAVNALVQFAALAFITLAALASRGPIGR